MRLKTYLNQKKKAIISPIFSLGSYITYIIYPQDEKKMWEPFMGSLILTFSYKK